MFSSMGSSVVGFGGGAPMASTTRMAPGRGDGCCDQDSRWGGTRGMCFKPELVEPNWSYVGAGKGGYEKVETYNYVGEGAGSYDKDYFSQHVVYGWRLRSCCLFFLCSAVLLVLFTVFASYLETLWTDVLPSLLPGAGSVDDINPIGKLTGNFTQGLQDGAGSTGVCTAAGKDCTKTKCCVNQSMRCFEKNEHWAGCRTSCSPGIFLEDPPQHRTRWNCLLIDTKGAQGLLDQPGSTSATPATAPSSTPSPFEPWPKVLAEGDDCLLDGSTGTCAAGTTCSPGLANPVCTRDLIAPSPESEATPDAPVVTGVAPDKVSTKTCEAVTIGGKTLMLEQTTGIVVGSTVTISSGATSETGTIAALEDGVITLEKPWANSYPSGSNIVIVQVEDAVDDDTGIESGFAKSNHFTTVRGQIPAGVTELPVLTYRGFAVGDSILIENLGAPPGEQKEITAVSKTADEPKLVVRTPTEKAYAGEARVTLLGPRTLPEPPELEPAQDRAMAFEDGLDLPESPKEDTETGMMPMAPAPRAGKGRHRREPTNDIPDDIPEPPKDGTKFDCAQGFENWDAGWSDDKKYYCCKYYGRGCPPEETTTPKHDCAADFDDWETKWNSDKQFYCCKYYGRGCPDAPSICDAKCEYKGVTLTCSERVQYSATHQFRGQAEVCSLAHTQVLTECNVCKECPLEETDCEKKKSEFPYDCDVGFETWQESWSPGEQRWCCDNFGKGCPGPTSAEHLPACATNCVHDDGTMKTCGEWIQTVATEDFPGQAGSCESALDRVLKDCPVCTVCGLEESGCADAPPGGGPPSVPDAAAEAVPGPPSVPDAAAEAAPGPPSVPDAAVDVEAAPGSPALPDASAEAVPASPSVPDAEAEAAPGQGVASEPVE
ncbi:unnamed protein product [Prorocentrum cordatum]|uniref:Uncharacterized protein n=1 Tax=Prorocentrum cordatum TaxID=2364126 RepID=A0ABN9S119_9DINO|nr:unnamed protein product [Polarella glacialis]